MKKYIFIALFVLSPFMASAQTITTDEQIKALVDQLVALKVQLIYAQIAELQAQIDAINTKVNKPVEPVPGPIVLPDPTPVSNIAVEGSCGLIRTIVSGRAFTQATLDIKGSNTHQRNMLTPGNMAMSDVPNGLYAYTLDVYAGYTSPFTEGTWQDRRELIAHDEGNVSVNCD